MNADINKHPAISPDHQLPAFVPRHKGLHVVMWILLLLILAVPILLVLHHHEEAKKEAAAAKRVTPGITIASATAQKGDIGVYLDAIGTVTPVYTDSITSQVDGLVVAVHYTEGQRVSKDDPLVDIDPRPYRAMLLQAQGALERDQNVLAQAQMDLERYRAAWARNAIAKQTLDDQEKLVLQYEGTVKNDQGTVQYDQIQVDYCHITAPIAGRVGLRLVDPGNVVQSAGTVTLAVITQLEPITVIFTIPEDSLGQVEARLNAKAKLPVDAFDRTAQTKIASGALLTLDNTPLKRLTRTIVFVPVIIGLSLFPLTAPIVMFLRILVGAARPWEILVSIGLIIAATAGVIWLSARIFQVGILMTGKRFKFREVLRLARSR